MRKIALALVGTLVAAGAHAQAVDGAKVFIKCMVCHASPDKPPQNRIGPALHGVVGRKAGTYAGFSYSPAMKAFGKVWTPQLLDTYLTKPQAVVKGTKMSFPGLPSAADRAAVIAYLKKYSG